MLPVPFAPALLAHEVCQSTACLPCQETRTRNTETSRIWLSDHQKSGGCPDSLRPGLQATSSTQWLGRRAQECGSNRPALPVRPGPGWLLPLRLVTCSRPARAAEGRATRYPATPPGGRRSGRRRHGHPGQRLRHEPWCRVWREWTATFSSPRWGDPAEPCLSSLVVRGADLDVRFPWAGADRTGNAKLCPVRCRRPPGPCSIGHHPLTFGSRLRPKRSARRSPAATTW